MTKPTAILLWFLTALWALCMVLTGTFAARGQEPAPQPEVDTKNQVLCMSQQELGQFVSKNFRIARQQIYVDVNQIVFVILESDADELWLLVLVIPEQDRACFVTHGVLAKKNGA